MSAATKLASVPGAYGTRPMPNHVESNLLTAHGNRTVARACAANPSRRPVKPMPSVVVALTLTRATSQ